MKHLLTLNLFLVLLATVSLAAEPAQPAAPAPANQPGRIIQTVRPLFPPAMKHNAVRHGSVLMLLEVAPSGQLADVLVTAYTQREFADEALRVARLWQYEAARVDGEPTTTFIPVSIKFELEGVLIVAPRESGPAPSREQPESYAYEAREMQQLDRIPTPVKVVEPVYPQDWARNGVTGKITVDFYIDETGRVRMASCASGTNAQLAGLALGAVRGWEFTPPTSGGRPVLVKARQVFSFVEGAPAKGT